MLGAGVVHWAEAALGMEAVLGVEVGVAAVAALVIVIVEWPWVVVVVQPREWQPLSHQLLWADCLQ